MNRFHGVLSILLMAVCLFLAFFSILSVSIFCGFIYLFISVIFFLLIIYMYCTKCPNITSNTCRHIFPGLIAKSLPAKKQSNYTYVELIITVLSFLVIVIFPQYWLWKSNILFILFWGILMLALIDVPIFICKSCLNNYCIICPNKKNII